LGCDYCDSIKGIGPKKAVELIREHKTIDKILKVIDTKKYPIPEDWQYERARQLFKEPEVLDPSTIELKWEAPDEEGLVKFLVEEKNFSEDRIRKAVQKLIKLKSKSTQGRLDGFFKVIPSTTTKPALKRKDSTPALKTKKKGKK
jgi:flap endonuclease-1